MIEPIPLSSAKADHYAKLRARLAVQKASEHEAIAAIDELCRDNERLALRSQASVAAALEAAAKEHDAEIVRLEAQIIENKNYLRLAGKSERSSANDFCDAAIDHHRGSAARLRSLITAPQRDALQAAIDAAVEKARAEDAVKIANLVQLIEAHGAMPEGFCCCSKDRIGDDSKIHEPECRDLRIALAQIGAKP